ncbi:hypothetical protein GA0115240_172029 [Streptomyces sp. DvalAA-14]|uniref:hypothetical protein n=1 Tax=unclassified Streptomyces TaxID=2593676 RepID=UPI00081AF6B1|nr:MULTISPECIES: hypothetical protein [unclassified Streptomyces]MYS24971.1 hypothetical protein [Streptomyces sp. SID4948]SCE51002.1 hypothetical protein GA0115240_172029 [Streptomyces sp. DvalAA-14]
MRVPITLATTAVTASAALLLAACGGGDATTSDKTPTSAAVTPSTSASASATASPTASATPGRPTITFPSYAKNVFEDQHTGDPTKDSVLADNEQWVDSMDDAIFQGSPNTEPLAFYSTGRGMEAALTYVHGYIAKGDKWAGITRFFARKVTLLGADTASVIYCSDESKSYITHPKKPTKHTPTSANSYVLYNTHLKKNAQGVWQTDSVLSDRGSKQCQP